MRRLSTVPRRGLTKFASNPETAPVILSVARTPIGSFNGALSAFTGPQLGTIALKEALKRSGVKSEEVTEAIFGNVISAGAGQAPARQVAIRAGLPPSVTCTTVNKVCSSGMKAVALGAQSIMLGTTEGAVATGGFESMSNVPYYLLKARQGYGYGHQQAVDGVLQDGLWDAFDDHHMGMCAEACAADMKISREDQDKYALESYRRAQLAQKEGWFKDEIVSVELPAKKGKEPKVVSVDEEPARLQADKVPTLRPAFKQQGGTVTAANASKLNDGGAALVLASAKFAKDRGLKPLARILGFADAEHQPIKFPTAPALALPRALKAAGVQQKDIDFFELNEAFSVVSLANGQLLNLDLAKVNAFGGAVALGHPIGCSGARILVTLLSVLKHKDATLGAAAICNGGGGASAVIIERIH